MKQEGAAGLCVGLLLGPSALRSLVASHDHESRSDLRGQ